MRAKAVSRMVDNTPLRYGCAPAPNIRVARSTKRSRAGFPVQQAKCDRNVAPPKNFRLIRFPDKSGCRHGIWLSRTVIELLSWPRALYINIRNVIDWKDNMGINHAWIRF